MQLRHCRTVTITCQRSEEARDIFVHVLVYAYCSGFCHTVLLFIMQHLYSVCCTAPLSRRKERRFKLDDDDDDNDCR